MPQKLWGEPFLTADFSSTPVKYQPFKVEDNFLLKACRSYFILYNSAAFTSIQMRIYSNAPLTSTPSQLLFTSSTSRTKAQLFPANTNGFKETFFEFSTYPNLKSGETYHFVPWISGYTGDASSHVAWVRDFPDPVNRTNLTVETKNLAVFPFRVYAIGADL